MDNQTESVDQKAKQWEQTFNDWVKKGMPDNDPDAPMPGNHPNPDHLWNINGEHYLLQIGHYAPTEQERDDI